MAPKIRTGRFHRQDHPDDVSEKISRVRGHPPLRLVHARLRRRPHPEADVGLLPGAEASDGQVVDLGLEFVSLSEAEVASGRPSLKSIVYFERLCRTEESITTRANSPFVRSLMVQSCIAAHLGMVNSHS